MTWHTFENLRPSNLAYNQQELRELVILTRLCRYNRNAPSGAYAIRKELQMLNIQPLPSISFISRVLREEGLTYRRTGNY